ncbi:MAG: clostripain-related cysteine peptidase [Pyrinomonadaceae bacterium]
MTNNGKKEWTIMIYLAGDNNLSVDMAHAMEQIKEVAGEEGNGINLFVYYDGNLESIPTVYCDFSDSANPVHVRSFQVQNKLYRTSQKRNENAADYRSVLNFVDWCLNKRGRRADKYGLIFSGHSLGFNDPGLFKDESSGKTMKMEEMFMLIDRLTKNEDELAAEVHAMDKKYKRDHDFESDPHCDQRQSTKLVGQKLDILGFDSCVMGMLEVGYQFKTNATTLIASEGSVPSAGWTYAKILGSLAHDERPLDDNDVAARFVRKFIESQDSFTVGGSSVDMAAWDMAKIDGLNEKFQILADSLWDCFKHRKSPVYRNMERALLKVHWQCQSYMHDQNVDIGDFCELLRLECISLAEDLGPDEDEILEKVQQACDEVLAELSKVVILSGFSGGEYQYSNGIALYFPWSFVTYLASEKYYENLEFVEKGAGKSWNKFLRRYLGEVTLRKLPERTMAAGAGAEASSKHRYPSFKYNEDERSLGIVSQIDSRMGGESGGKMGGESGGKMGGESGGKMGGESGGKMGGESGGKMGGESGGKMGGESGGKMGGESGGKMGGESGGKMGGGGSSNVLFSSLRLHKNIETKWNISGFTKTPAESESDGESADATHG